MNDEEHGLLSPVWKLDRIRKNLVGLMRVLDPV